MKPGALQRPSGALRGRYESLTPPEGRWGAAAPARGRGCVYPFRGNAPFPTHLSSKSVRCTADCTSGERGVGPTHQFNSAST